MILAMIVIYCFLLYLMFDVFKVVKSTTRNRIYVTLIGIFGIICILFFINWFQPMSTDLRVFRYTVPISPRVSGRVIEVNAEMDVPIKKGDVLFKIDPRPYEAEVARLEALVAESEQLSKMAPVDLQAAQTGVAKAEAALIAAQQQAEGLMAKYEGASATVEKLESQVELAKTIYERDLRLSTAIAKQEIEVQLRNLKAAEASLTEAQSAQTQARLALDSKIGEENTLVVQAREALALARANEAKAKLTLESTIDGVDTTVAQNRAALANARINLEDTVVRAPADGFLPDVALRHGQYLTASGAPVLSFVNEEEYAMAASFPQVVLRNIEVDDEVEIALDDYPGYTFSGKVKTVSWGINQGQVNPSGQIVDAKPVPHGRFFVELTINNAEDLRLPAGEAGAATIYTQYGKPFVTVRKVFFRWYTWINFVIPDMDIRGERG